MLMPLIHKILSSRYPFMVDLNDTTHVLSGTPANEDVDVFDVTLRITDGKATVDQVFKITVSNVTCTGIYDRSCSYRKREGSLYV